MEITLKSMIIIAIVVTLCSGCVSNDTGIDDSSDQALRNDESCDIFYSMVEGCVEAGRIDRSIATCEKVAEAIRALDVKYFYTSEDDADFMQRYCLNHCKNAIDGLPAPRVSEVCVEEK